jgi:PDZ domain-containing protein
VHIDLEVFSADDTAAQQSNQTVKFLHAHPDEQLAIVAMPVMDIGQEQPLENLGRKVLSRGVAWTLLNRDVEPHVMRMRGEFPSLPVGLVTIDNLEIGRIQGRQVKSLLPFVIVELTDGRKVVVDRARGRERSPAILKRYGVPRDRSEDLDP